MIALKNIEKSFGEKHVLSGVSLALPTGEVTALMGASGSGKTTLFRILLGLEVPDAGELVGLEGLRISAVFQEDRLLDRLTAVGNIRFVGGTNAEELLAELSLLEETKAVRSFSGGMKRRVALARALSVPFDLLLLDEPFRGLDENARQAAAESVLRHSRGKTVLLITHDRREAELLNARIITLKSE